MCCLLKEAVVVRKDYQLMLELHRIYTGHCHLFPYFTILYHYALNQVAQ